MHAAAKFGSVGVVAGLAAGLMFVPTVASGNARTSAGTGTVQAQIARPFIARLLGANEIAGGDTDGTGAATITIDPVSGEVCFDLRVANLTTVSAAHIHPGAAGVNGAPLVTLTPPAPTSSGCVNTTPENAASIAATPANFYINVHTADFQNGALRGQLAPAPTVTGAVHVLTEPVRVYDSRSSTQGALAAGTTRAVSLGEGKNGAGATVVAVPPGASAALVTLTLDQTVGQGFVTAYSNALASAPTTSTINWSTSGATIATSTTVAVDALAMIKLTAGQNKTHVIVDVVGFLF